MARDHPKALRHSIEEIQELEHIKFARMLTTEEMRVICESWHAMISAQMTWEAVKEAYGATDADQGKLSTRLETDKC
jgi:hypothetical protein